MSLLDRPFLAPAGDSTLSLGRALGLTATLALVALAVLLPVTQSSGEATQGYRMQAMEQQQSDLEAQIYKAQSDIAQLGALARVDGEARGRLGMIPVTHEVAITVAVPEPSVRPIPNGFAPESMQATAPEHETLWKKFITLLSFV
jgi:hypothetical protein